MTESDIIALAVVAAALIGSVIGASVAMWILSPDGGEVADAQERDEEMEGAAI